MNGQQLAVLKKAIERRGGAIKLASDCGLSKQTVYNYLNNDREPPTWLLGELGIETKWKLKRGIPKNGASPMR